MLLMEPLRCTSINGQGIKQLRKFSQYDTTLSYYERTKFTLELHHTDQGQTTTIVLSMTVKTL